MTEFRSHVFIRTIWFTISYVTVATGKYRSGNANLAAMAIFYITLCVFNELVFWVQMKAQVKLLLASKMLKFQEK